MNKHIKLVRKWLADPQSVSLEELEANATKARAYSDDAAYAAAAAYIAAAKANAADDAAAYAASRAIAVAYAAHAAYSDDVDTAINCIKVYEELTKEIDA